MPRPLIVFYCHQLRGLGHFAFCARVANQMAADSRFAVGLVTDADTTFQDISSGCRVLQLPRVMEPFHHPDNRARLEARTENLVTVIRDWQPDLMLVDMLPVGIGGEIAALMESADGERWPTQFGLNIRYREGLVARLPKNPRISAVHKRYSVAIGYGDSRFEPVLSDLKAFPGVQRQAYVGMFAAHPTTSASRNTSSTHVVVLCGGGGGYVPRFLRNVILACRSLLESSEIRMTCVSGPLADQAEVAALPTITGLEITRVATAEAAMATADLVISRCGYNTAYTLVQGDLPIIFVPLVGPYDDQENRARRLAELDRVWCICEEEADFGGLLRNALGQGLASGRANRDLPFMMNRYDLLFDFLGNVCAPVLGKAR